MVSLTVVIPAYNEERRLPATLEAVVAYAADLRPAFFELIVVNDGSTDDTAGVVKSYASAHRCVRLLDNPGNRGKGYSVRHGMLKANGDWALSTDADLSSPIQEFEKLFAAAKQAGAPVAIGSRAIDRSLIGIHQSGFREASGRLFNAAMRAATGLPFRDTQCGFKLFRADAAREIFLRQQLDGFSFDVEDLYIASRLGYKVVEVPVRWNNVEGTKVRMTEGLRSFSDLLRIRRYHMAGRYQNEYTAKS